MKKQHLSIILTSILFLLKIVCLFGQSPFVASLDQPCSITTWQSKMLPLPNGQIILTGGSYTCGGPTNGTVKLLEADGTEVWQRCYGGSGQNDQIRAIASAGDGGYWAIGHTNGDGWLLRLDSVGNLLWDKTYGGSNNGDDFFHLLVLADGSLAVGGTSYSSDGDVPMNNGQGDIWAMKIDHQGEVIWSKNYGSAYSDYVEDFDILPNGNLVVLAFPNGGGGDVTGPGKMPWLLHIDPSNGNLTSSSYFGTAGNNHLYAMLINSQEELLAVGTGKIFQGNDFTRPWIIKLATNGDILLDTVYSIVNSSLQTNSIIELQPDRYIWGAFSNSYQSDGSILHSSYINAMDDAGAILYGNAVTNNPINYYGMISDAVAIDSSSFWVLSSISTSTNGTRLTKFEHPVVPIIEAMADTTICFGEHITLAASVPNCSYCSMSWRKISGEFIANPNLLPTATNSYVFTATAAIGYVSSDTVTVTVSNFGFDIDPQPNMICGPGNGKLKAVANGGFSDNYTYEWNTGAMTPTIEGLGAGDYSVTVFDGACHLTDDISLNFGQPPYPVDVLIADTLFCPGTSVTVTANMADCPNCIYTWEDGSMGASKSFTTDDTQAVSIFVTTPEGCEGIDYQQLIEDKVGLQFSIVGTNCLQANGNITAYAFGSAIHNNPVYTYVWEDGTHGNLLDSLTIGKYTVTVSDGLCEASATGEIGWKEGFEGFWQRHLSNIDNQYNYFDKLSPTTDGGAIVSGRYEGQNVLQRIDSTGQIVWTQDISMLPNAIESTLDDGFFTVLGATIERYDSLGTLIWETTVSPGNQGKLIALSNGGCIIALNSYTSTANIQVYLVRLDENGNILWDKYFGGSKDDTFTTIGIGHQLGEYLISGKSNSSNGDIPTNAGSYDAWLFSINEDGDMLWSKTFGGAGNDLFQNIVASHDGLIRVKGQTESNNGVPANADGTGQEWNLLLHPNGDIIHAWRYSYPLQSGGYYSWTDLTIPTTDGGWFVFGRHNLSQTESYGYGVKISQIGKLELTWGSYVHYFNDLKLAKPDQFIYSGDYRTLYSSPNLFHELIEKTGFTQPLPNPLPFPDTIHICADDPIPLYTASTGFNYLWSTGDTTEAITATQSGDYWVTQSTPLGCNLTDTVHLDLQTNQLPLLELGDTLHFCTDSLFDSNHPGPFYQWSTGDTTQATLLPNNAGWISLRVSDGGHCFREDTAFVQPRLSIEATHQDVTCFGENNGSIAVAVENATGTLNFAWDSGSTNEPLNNLPPGSYHATITDAAGCTATASSTISEPSELELGIFKKKNISCFGGSNGEVIAAANGGTIPYHWKWSNMDTSNQSSDLPAGSYNVTLTDANGCVKTLTSQLTEPTQLIMNTAIVQPGLGLSNGSISINPSGGVPPYSIYWDNGHFGPDLLNLPAGLYSLTVKDSNNCSIQLAIQLDALTGVEELGAGQLQVWPNPFSDKLFLETNKPLLSIEIKDCLGRSVPVFSEIENYHFGGSRYSISTTGLQPGIYFIFARTTTETLAPVKLVKH